MTIPYFDVIRLEALKFLKSNEEVKLKDFEKPLSIIFSLTSEELNRMYESGNGRIFYDRISWAMSYLAMSGLVDKPKRGVYRINNLGISMLGKDPNILEKYVVNKVNSRKPSKNIKETEISSDIHTPEEDLYNTYKDIRGSIYDEIIDIILKKSPFSFESLVVQLLKKMGYGGEIKDSGKVTQASNDGGIDGIIKEDVLGFGKIYIQAKRYSRDNTVGRADIQSFVGALAVAQSNKGVFITTSKFSKGAIEYAKNLNGTTSIILINGDKLAEYIYNFDLGMQLEQTIEIKKMDAEFWDSIPDE